MTDNGVSHEEGSPNLPGHRSRTHGGDDGLDTWEARHGRDYGKYGFAAQHTAATFYGQGGNFAFGASESPELVNYSAVLRMLWRRKLLLISIAVLGIGGATAIIACMPAHYVAHAFVAIGDPLAKSRLSHGANQGGGLASLPDTGTVQTEIEILKSPAAGRRGHSRPQAAEQSGTQSGGVAGRAVGRLVEGRGMALRLTSRL